MKKTLLVAALCGCTFGANAADHDDAATLSQVVVTATRTAITEDDALASVSVITREDIERLQPFTQLVAVLVAGLPSAGWIFIFATRYGADAGRISATILLTTALAFASFSGLVWVLGIGRH